MRDDAPEDDDMVYYSAFMQEQLKNSQTEYAFFTFQTDKNTEGKSKTRKIQFDPSLPSEPMTPEQIMAESYATLEAEGGLDAKTSLARVNPELFRNLKYMCTISPDVKNPMSEDLERIMGLELYDRGIANPLLDQEQLTRDFLLGSNPKSKRDPDKYIMEQQPVIPGAVPPGQAGAPEQGMPGGQPSTPPIAA
jgi:hypothetical protein